MPVAEPVRRVLSGSMAATVRHRGAPGVPRAQATMGKTVVTVSRALPVRRCVSNCPEISLKP